MKIKNPSEGFTLLEVLISLFIFSLLGVMLATGLRTVINMQGDVEGKAERLRNLQLGFLVISRDLEQAIPRPIINAAGKEEAALIGTPTGFVLTHMGYALQRSACQLKGNSLVRETWPVLDQAPRTKALTRLLIGDVTEARFEYLDAKGHMHADWPPEKSAMTLLPRGVRVHLSIKHWGGITQFYLIPAENRQSNENPAT